MRLIPVLSLCAALATLSISASAYALTVENTPRNADGSARFADPDAMFDQQAEAYQHGRWGGQTLMFGGDANDAWGRSEIQPPPFRLRDPGDRTCVTCASVDVDGVLRLRHDGDDTNDR